MLLSALHINIQTTPSLKASLPSAPTLNGLVRNSLPKQKCCPIHLLHPSWELESCSLPLPRGSDTLGQPVHYLAKLTVLPSSTTTLLGKTSKCQRCSVPTVCHMASTGTCSSLCDRRNFNFYFCLISINLKLNLKSHIWLVAAILDSTDL